MFTLTFGVTTLAISTVLSSFFGGLALGSYVIGKWIDKKSAFLKWYGLAELIIGIFALLFPFLLSLVSKSYVFIAQTVELGFYQMSLVKFLLVLLLLIIPTTFMGATLPILGKFSVKSKEHIAGKLGKLYAINTFGAVLGTLATGFYLIPIMGIKAILFSAGMLNIALGLFALKLNKNLSIDRDKTEEDQIEPISPSSPSPSSILPPQYLSLVLFGFGISGFTALSYEVVWTRVLELVFTGTIYAFSTILATFLVGIAAGSAIFSWYLNRPHSIEKEGNLFAFVEMGIGFSTILLIFIYNGLPNNWLYNKIFETTDWSSALAIKFFITFILLFLPAFLFGSTFPIVCKLYSRNIKSIGHSVGNIYSINTVGGILGSFLTGFIFIPLLGMQTSIVMMGCINIILGISLLMLHPHSTKVLKFSTTTVSVALILLLFTILPENMVKSIYSGFLGRNDSIIYYKEGISATVMISEKKGMSLNTSNKRLYVNGNQATAAYYEGLQINRFQGVLPMVLHPNPKDVLVICFGSGTTFGTLSLFDVDKVDNVEISRAVIQGAKYFTWENQDVLHNPKSNIIINDGRNHLLTTTKKYDVITQEPMHPSLVGVVNLYTKEYYELAKARLKPKGIISQWIPLYNLTVDDVKTMVKTFQSVFPHASIWITNVDIFLIGSPEKLQIDYQWVQSRLNNAKIKSVLKDIDMEDPVEFVSSFLMNEDQVRAYASDAIIMEDNWPYVEFNGPKSLLMDTVLSNIVEFTKYMENVGPYLKTDNEQGSNEQLQFILNKKFQAAKFNLTGRGYAADRDFKTAETYFDKALNIDPSNRNSLHYKHRFKLMKLGL